MSDETDKLSFGQAIERLEGILRKVEEEEIDIDELGERLKEATGLLELCRTKIRKAEVEVSQIVQALEEPAGTASEVEEADDSGVDQLDLAGSD